MSFLHSKLNKIYELVIGEKISNQAESFIRNLVRAFLGYSVAGFSVFVFEIIAGKTFGPQTYGKYVLVSSIGLFLYLFTTLGVNAAMVKYGAGADNETRKKIISSGYFIAIFSSIFFGFIFFVFSNRISALLSVPESVFLAAIVLGILFGFYVMATDSLRALYRIKNLAFFRASYGILILALLFLFFNFVSRTSFLVAVFSICISYFIIIVAITFKIKKYFTFKIDKFWIKELLVYGSYAAIAGLMLTFLATQSQLFINWFSSSKEVGIYAAYYFSSINITVFLYNIFIVVFFPAVSMLRQKQAAFKKIGKLIPFLFFIWLPLLFLIQIIALKFYGSQYPINIPLMLAFEISAILICIYGLYSWFFYSLGVSWVKKITLLTVFVFPTNILLNLFLVPRFSLWGAIFSTFLTYVISLFSLFIISKKERKKLFVSDNFSVTEKHRNCNNCNSSEKEVLFNAEEQRVVKCKYCGLVYVDNPLDSSKTKNFYDKYYTDFSYIGGEKFRRKEAEDRLDKIVPVVSILDIGCGTGVFVKEAYERGIKAIGIDVTETGVRYGQKQGLDLRVGDILDINDFSNGSFDVVTLWATIEHLQDPKKTLEKIYNFLVPNGLLVIETGDIGSFQARLFGKKWRLIKQGHNFYYSSKTIDKLLEKTGFAVCRTEYDGFVESIITQIGLQDWAVNRFIKSPEKVKEKDSSLKEVINKFAGKIRLGDIMMKYARKR